MKTTKEIGLARAASADPTNLLRQMTAEVDRMFNQELRWPALAHRIVAKTATWYPEIDVFERNNCLVAKIDLPGLKKDEVTIEVADGRLTMTGERQTETSDKKHNFYRCERAYGSFFRAISLPDGVAVDDIRATFTDGVLEVSVPLPPPDAAPKPRTVKIDEPVAAA
jgi:HSP20 family protein